MPEPEKLKDNMESALEEGESRVEGGIDTAERKLRNNRYSLAKRMALIDRQAHENPWPLVTGVAFSCLVLGLIMGKSRS